MPKHEHAPSGYPEPRLNRTRDEMIADFREDMAERRKDPIRYYLGDSATPDQIEEFTYARLVVPQKGNRRKKRR